MNVKIVLKNIDGKFIPFKYGGKTPGLRENFHMLAEASDNG